MSIQQILTASRTQGGLPASPDFAPSLASAAGRAERVEIAQAGEYPGGNHLTLHTLKNSIHANSNVYGLLFTILFGGENSGFELDLRNYPKRIFEIDGVPVLHFKFLKTDSRGKLARDKQGNTIDEWVSLSKLLKTIDENLAPQFKNPVIVSDLAAGGRFGFRNGERKFHIVHPTAYDQERPGRR